MKMIKNVYGLNKMHFMDAEYVDGILFFYDILSERFFLSDLATGQSKLVNLTGETNLKMDCPRKLVCYGDDFYLVQSNVCVIYHFKRSENEIVFDEKIVANEFKGKVKNAFIFDGILWIIPMESNGIIAGVDLTRKIIEYRRLKTDFNSKSNYVIRDVLLQAPYLYFNYVGSNIVGRYNIKEDNIDYLNTGIPEVIEGIAIRENDLILRAKGGQSYYAWNYENKQYSVIAKSETKYEEMGKVTVLSDGAIIVCPILGKDFYYIDEEKKSIERIKEQSEIRYENGVTFTIGMREVDGNLYIYPWAGEKIVEIYRGNNEWEIKEKPLVMQVDEYKEYINYLKRKGQPIFEQEDISVKDFIQFI